MYEFHTLCGASPNLNNPNSDLNEHLEKKEMTSATYQASSPPK